MGDTIRMVPPEGGDAVDVPLEKVQTFRDMQYTVQDNAARAGEVVEAARADYYDTAASKVEAAYAGAARGITGGLSDVAIRAVGGDDARRKLSDLREYNPGISTVTEIGGSLLPFGAGGAAGRLAGKLIGKGAGAVSQVARAGARGVIEGGVQGAGEGLSQLALSEDPITWERATSVLSSNMLFGAKVGGVAGLAGKVVEKGLGRAKKALDDVAERSALNAGGDVAPDLAQLDRKGLRAAQQTELDAIEAARVPKRAELADEIKAFRQELKDNKPWLATKGSDEAAVREIGARTRKADRALDTILNDPKALASSPESALRQLRIQEAALDDLVNKQGTKLRAKFAADTSGDRLAALEYSARALETNRGLQKRIGELAAAPVSDRLTAIADATDALQTGKASKAMPQQLLEGGVFGTVTGLASPLGPLAPLIGAKASSMVGDMVFGRMTKATGEVSARMAKATQAFLDVTKKVTPAAPVLATKLLSRVSFAPAPEKKTRTAAKPAGRKHELAAVFKARTDEVRSQVTMAPDGSYQMRPEARSRMGQQFTAIAAMAPLLADRMESAAAARIEFLASKMPRRPDMVGMQFGPDRWQPSDMQMREWGRYVAAVEDPAGVVERLAAGTITPEDGEAMKAVYPEMFAQIQTEIVSQLPTLRKQLPYSRRISLSIFSGVAVDPAMDPNVLAVLQSTYAGEGGTGGGVQAPRAQPQFGSVKKSIPQPTPAQERAG